MEGVRNAPILLGSIRYCRTGSTRLCQAARARLSTRAQVFGEGSGPLVAQSDDCCNSVRDAWSLRGALRPVLNFGNVPVGTTSAPQVWTVTNQSSLFDLQTGLVTITGDFNDFRAQGNCSGAIIPPLGSCQLSVTFRPTVLGLRTATLNIPFVGDSSQQVGLQGFGVSPPLAAVSLSPPRVTFPNKQVVGSSSALQTVVVKNVGNASLHVSGVTVTGPNAADFAPPTSTCGVVAPGGTCSVMVKFTPAGTATRSATLLIADDAGGSPQSVPLSGIGVASCDINHDGIVNVLDVQLLVNQVLGISPATQQPHLET
jgi:hypothetical protein